LAGVEIRLATGSAPNEQPDERVFGQWSRAFQVIEISASRVQRLTERQLRALVCHEFWHAHIYLTGGVQSEEAANERIVRWKFDPDDLP
jgi:hypothetical protein